MKIARIGLLCCFLVNGLLAQDLHTAIDHYLDSLYKASNFSGVSLAVILPNGEAIASAKGKADLESNQSLNSRHFLLAGSIGKTIVAATALKLVEQGKLKLDEPISTYLGKEIWFDSIPNARSITVRMLMNHTSGIPEHVHNEAFLKRTAQEPDKIWTPLECIRYIFGKGLFEAGKDWGYADTNYIILGMIMEKITGKQYYDLANELILKPSGLKNIIQSDRRELKGVAIGYSQPGSPFLIEGPIIKDGKFVINPQLEWTGGGYATTPTDLARWAKYLYEGNAFNKEMLDMMLQGVPSKLGKNLYGLGVIIGESKYGKTYGHSGWFPGYISEVRYYPQYEFSIAIQFNTDDGSKVKGFGRFLNPISDIIVNDLKK
ncbi:MAG: serine hydrolase domain-containing protein [Saprospiraceae bacterium]|nr:serine hydrolase domain-containing protein [Saprospiraceae bacterium]